MPETVLQAPVATARRVVLQLALFAIISALSGCASLQGVEDYIAYNDTTNDFVMGWRNSVWARQAWYERKHQFVGENQFASFGEGFRAGYEDVASGGNGCPPAIPPRKFWSWKYQSPEGQAKVAAWFAGYPYGAQAAEEDGAGHYQQIQVSHIIEKQYSPEFLNGCLVPEGIPGSVPGEVIAPPSGQPISPATPPTSVPSAVDMSNYRAQFPSNTGYAAMPGMNVEAGGPVMQQGSRPMSAEYPAYIDKSFVMQASSVTPVRIPQTMREDSQPTGVPSR